MDGTIMMTPLGRFAVVVEGTTVVASGWAESLEQLRVRRVDLASGVRVRREIGSISRAVDAYFEGDLTAVDDIEVRQTQGEFMDRALQVLRTVAPGRTVSYSDLAALSGNPGAARAAGTACARNNAPLYVPCHRVVRSDGSLGGFGYGLPMKRWLLDHEAGAALPARSA